ncbi:MAG: hypothetical protein AVDCRST_MAG64-4470 [uncultured Phycisphaerae bacterium]|uniref:N-acetylmuramoyl-L-alanine amidase n=1 Tax=uncultured Phycisphaerae bacterium TaxID=904963 RepID=A0A6J4QSH1_9BACT|nr:MAG: hypothetical protein AVDCRST_MAG64-4470 [uncultured Phycisphaerae bacterium]
MPRRVKRQPRLPRNALLLFLLGVATVVLLFGLRRGGPAPADAPGPAAAEARWMPAEKSDRWKCIVIHHSAGEAGGADRFDELHRDKGWDELGYHFVIGNGSDTADGQVEVGSRWAAQKHGAHCKTKNEYYNNHGIGICLVGNFELHPPAERQLQSLRRLVAFLSREFGIPPERVYTHGGVTRQTHCPGKHFDLAALRKSLPRR